MADENNAGGDRGEQAGEGLLVKRRRWLGGKSWWDLLDLIIIPAVIGVGLLLLNNSQRNREVALEAERINADALQTYFGEMAELILDYNLQDEAEGEKARSIARARTLAVLRTLDSERKGSLLKFLHESELIDKETTIVSLEGAALWEAYLSGADLEGADLNKADLRWAGLGEAKLETANLSGADLYQAGLRGANLTGANLSGAILYEADLREAGLRGADLSLAILSGAYLTKADLTGADLTDANLEGAHYDNETLWPTGFNPEEAEAIREETSP